MMSRAIRTISRRSLRAATAAAAIALASPAMAGLVDSPVPPLKGQPAMVVYYVPGVQGAEPHGTPNLETVFTCTSLESSVPVVVGVQVFDYTSAGPLNSYLAAQTVAPGATISISTNQPKGLSVGDRLGIEGAVLGGSARILGTSKKIMCSAVLARTAKDAQDDADWDDYDLTASANLRVVRTDQKGD